MKTIGLLGGTSWESTQEYYRIINEEVQKRLGHKHSARIAMYSIDFNDVDRCISHGRMDELTDLICKTAQKIQAGGADCLLICANTMHMLAEDVKKAIDIPLIHIAEVTRDAVAAQAFRCVGLLGTKPTMEMSFYKDIFMEKGIKVLTPEAEDRDYIQQNIFSELFRGELKESSRLRYLEIMKGLADQGAQGIILGCTEIPLLIKQQHTTIPLFDTTYIHASAGVNFSLNEK
jgi:aspartate racemase